MYWHDFADYLKENFSSLDDTDIHCFGCSNGKEAYSLAILLKECFPGQNFKIKASDIREEQIQKNIKEQKEGVYLCNWDKFQTRASWYPHDKLHIIEKYIEETDESKKHRYCEMFPYVDNPFYNEEGKTSLRIKPEITDCVEFKTVNILESLDEIDSTKKSIIMCRNMWPYIDPKEYDKFAKKLYDKLAPGSIVIVGDFDLRGDEKVQNSHMFPHSMIKNKFSQITYKEILSRPVYRKGFIKE